jgi:hypothetical protein
MKIKNLNELREAMEKIMAVVCAADSVPAMIMKATRPNDSKDWDEAGDARRFDESLPQRMEEYEKATEALISNRRP